MNPRPLFVALLTAFSFSFASAPAYAADPTPAPQEQAETELARAMATLNSSWRKLRRQAADPGSNRSSLDLVATIKTASLKSAELAPDLARDQPENERAKFIAAYQDRMKEFLAQLGKLEAAFIAGDNPLAVDLIKHLGNLQRDGHKEFRRPDSE